MNADLRGLEIERRLEQDADGSYTTALLSLLNAECRRVERHLSTGTLVEEYRGFQCLSEGLAAATVHLHALAARNPAGIDFSTANPAADGTGEVSSGPAATYKLLIELGFSAAFRGLTDRATKMFAAGRVVRPRKAHPFLGEAIVRLQKLELSEAAHLLQQAVRLEPGNELVKAFSAVCMRLLRQLGEGREAFQEVVGKDVEDRLAGRRGSSLS